MQIRKYNSNTDQKSLEIMMTDFFNQADPKIILQGYNPSDDIVDLLKRNGDIYVMIDPKGKGKIAGFHRGEILHQIGSTYRSSGIYVAPMYRKRGYGSLLISHQESIAKERNCIGIQSIVYGENEGGLALAKKKNYKYDFRIQGRKYSIYKTLS